MFYCTPKGTLTAWKNLGKTCKKQKTLEKPGKTKKKLETTCKKTKQPWKNLGKQKKHGNTLEQPAKTLEKHGKTKKTSEQQKIKKQKKTNKKKTKNKKQQKKTIFLDSLEGGVPAKTLWELFFFGFSNVFFVLVTFSHLHLFVHWPFGVFMRSSLQEPIV